MPRSAACLAGLVALCVGPSPTRGQEEPAPYFPTTAGTKLVYQCGRAGKNESVEVVQVVTRVDEVAGGAKRVTVGLVAPGGAVYPSQTFEVSARGVYWVAAAAGVSDRRPWCMVKLPHDPGQTWDDGAGNRLTARGPERVRVPAGAFECIVVEYRDGKSPAPTCTRWFAPGVGEVKSVAGDAVVELKSFTPGKG